MKDLHTVRYRADAKLVSQPVSANSFPLLSIKGVTQLELAVAIAVETCQPRPALVGIPNVNLGPKALLNGSPHGYSVIPRQRASRSGENVAS